MNKLSTLCKGEVKKSIRFRHMLFGAVAIFILCLLVTIFFDLIFQLSKDGIVPPPVAQYESYEQAINYFEVTVAEDNIQRKASGTYTRSRFRKAEKQRTYYLAFYKHLQENNLPLTTTPNSPDGLFSAKGKNAFSYSSFLSSIAMTIATIIGISLLANSMADEERNGTLKLLLSRPVTKNKLLASRFITVFIYSSLFIFATAFISLVVGAIKYGLRSADIILVFGSVSAFTSNTVGAWILSLFSYFFLLFSFLAFTQFIGTLTKSKTITLVLSLGILIGGNMLVSILANFSMDWLVFSAPCSISSMFTLTDTTYHFGVGIFLAIFYNVMFLGLSHLIFNLRDN